MHLVAELSLALMHRSGSCNLFLFRSHRRMRRISPDEIRYRIYVLLRTYSRSVKRQLVAKLPLEGDKATAEIADAIAEKIAGGDYRVIAPDLERTLNDGQVPGRWSEDDPDPTTGL